MENKQTAVDWLIEHIKLDVMYEAKSIDEWSNYFKKAKAMEKEQIGKAYESGCIGEVFELNCNHSSEQYYNETYGK